LAISSAQDLFRRAVAYGAYLALAIAGLGSAISVLTVGLAGVYAALIGAAISTSFSLMTIFSVWFGSKLPLNGFYALVLGGWLIKVVLFGVVLSVLQGAQNFNGPVFFFAIVAGVLGGLGIDSWLVLKARIPTVENQG
jgi:membrane associated rhomboid family serine protease